MKKLIPVLLIFLLLLSGCNKPQEAPTISTEAPVTETTVATAVPVTTEVPATESVQSRIESKGEGIFVDSVKVTDGAYDRVGVVLYTSLDGQTTYAAFLGEDGNYVSCGVFAKPYYKPELTYLGDGAVTFLLQREDKTPYLCKVTYSLIEDGKGSNFKIETDFP